MGSGAARAMITILKNNKNMLSKKRSRTSMADYEKKRVEFKVDSASPKLLKQIRRRVKNHQKEKELIIWFTLVFIMTVLICVFLYFF